MQNLLKTLLEENALDTREVLGEGRLTFTEADLDRCDNLRMRRKVIQRYLRGETVLTRRQGSGSDVQNRDTDTEPLDSNHPDSTTTPAPSGQLTVVQPSDVRSVGSGVGGTVAIARHTPPVSAPHDETIVSVQPEALKARHALTVAEASSSSAIDASYRPPKQWKIAKVLLGHQGWVWSVAVDPGNAWFATGGFDSVIKVWDMLTGELRTDLVGHTEGVRSIALSQHSPYMFSGSDDHAIKCWDLERNECIREFFGHKSAVHTVATHPSMDVIFSGGRDRSVRVFDIRTRAVVHTLVGHTDSVMSLASQAVDPQVISGGSDGMIFMWDIRAGAPLSRLTRHKKPVRGLTLASGGAQLVSCGADEVRVWSLPSGEYQCATSTVEDNKYHSKDTKTGSGEGHRRHRHHASGGKGRRQDGAGEEVSYRWSCCAMSPRNVLAVAAQDGQLALYEWQRPQLSPARLFYAPFQLTKTKDVPGTQTGEGGVSQITFDMSGTRLITAETDKSVKMWSIRE